MNKFYKWKLFFIYIIPLKYKNVKFFEKSCWHYITFVIQYRHKVKERGNKNEIIRFSKNNGKNFYSN